MKKIIAGFFVLSFFLAACSKEETPVPVVANAPAPEAAPPAPVPAPEKKPVESAPAQGLHDFCRLNDDNADHTPQYELVFLSQSTTKTVVGLPRLQDQIGSREIIGARIDAYGRSYTELLHGSAELTSVEATDSGFRIAGTYKLKLGDTTPHKPGMTPVRPAEAANEFRDIDCTVEKSDHSH